MKSHQLGYGRGLVYLAANWSNPDDVDLSIPLPLHDSEENIFFSVFRLNPRPQHVRQQLQPLAV